MTLFERLWFVAAILASIALAVVTVTAVALFAFSL
jgi:hypothetical protein